jgi:hypothetical protein
MQNTQSIPDPAASGSIMLAFSLLEKRSPLDSVLRGFCVLGIRRLSENFRRMALLKDTTQTKRHLREAFGNRKEGKPGLFTKPGTMRTFAPWSFCFFTRTTSKPAERNKKNLKRPAIGPEDGFVREPIFWPLNPFRRILIRPERKPDNYLAFLHLACAHIVWKSCTLANPFEVFG